MILRIKPIALILIVILAANAASPALAFSGAAGIARVAGNQPLLAGGEAEGGVHLAAESAQGLRFSVDTPMDALQLSEIEVEGERYVRLSLADWVETAVAGAPQLPFVNVPFGAPAGAGISLKITTGKVHEFHLSAPLLPHATKEAVLREDGINSQASSITKTETRVEPDLAIYESSGAYPAEAASVGSDGFLREQRVVGVNLYPVRYYPAKNVIFVYESIEVEVVFSGNGISFGAEKKAESDYFEKLYEHTLLNYETAKGWRGSQMLQPAQMASSPGVESVVPWVPPSPGYRISTTDEGVHKLSYAELMGAGVPVETVDPRSFQLFNHGVETAIWVAGEEDGVFDESDFILFYATTINTKYTDENVYWLTYGGTGYGLRMAEVDGTPGLAGTAASFWQTIHTENNLYYIRQSPGDDRLDRWFGSFIPTSTSNSVTYSYQLSAPTSAQASLKFSVLGYRYTNHDIHVKLNNANLGSFQFTGKTYQIFEVTVPAGLLVSGLNQLEFSTTETNQAAVYLDWIDLTFERGFGAEEDRLSFEYAVAGTARFQIGGFTSAAISVFDVTNPTNAVHLTGGEIVEDSGTYEISFEDEVVGAVKVFVAEGSAFLAVNSIVLDEASNLGSTSHGADYIVITPEIFISQANTLSAYRAGKGLRTAVVKLQDIYDEFGYGIRDVDHIRDFLAYTYHHWQAPAPAFVLLLGDGNQDPKKYDSTSLVNLMPSYLAAADPWDVETAADNRYVTIVGEDTMPDMMLGRLTAEDVAEANILINKIIAYESTASETWKQQILFAADDSDSGGNFSQISDNIIDCCLPERFQTERVFFKVTHATVSSMRGALVSAINQGALIVNYIGHASSVSWGDEGLFRKTELNSLTNGNRLAIVLSMTCLDGRYQDHKPGVSRRSLAESLTGTFGKGAIASWSPTGMGVAAGHDYLNRGFFEAVLDNGAATLGEGTAAGKLRLWLAGSNLDLIDTYLLFGDPAMVINHSPVAYDQNAATPEDTVAEIPLVAVSPQGNLLTYEIVTQPAHGAASVAGNIASYTPDADYYGTDIFTFKVFDGSVFSNTATVSVTIAPVNDAPVLDPIGNQTVDELSELTFIATASDIEMQTQTLTFSLIGAPAGAVITAEGVASWTPTEAQGPGTYGLTVRVCDSGMPALCDEEEIQITVAEVNAAPVLAPIGHQIVELLDTLTFTASASDEDLPAQALVFSLVGAPVGAVITAGGDFSWTPLDVGEFDLTVQVCDDALPALCATEVITITVNQAGQTPRSVYLPLIIK